MRHPKPLLSVSSTPIHPLSSQSLSDISAQYRLEKHALVSWVCFVISETSLPCWHSCQFSRLVAGRKRRESMSLPRVVRNRISGRGSFFLGGAAPPKVTQNDGCFKVGVLRLCPSSLYRQTQTLFSKLVAHSSAREVYTRLLFCSHYRTPRCTIVRTGKRNIRMKKKVFHGMYMCGKHLTRMIQYQSWTYCLRQFSVLN